MIDVKRLVSEAESYATQQTSDVVDWKAIAQERFANLVLEEAAKVCDEAADRSKASADKSRVAADANTYWTAAGRSEWLANAIRSLKVKA
jgi:hypothetical protein